MLHGNILLPPATYHRPFVLSASNPTESLHANTVQGAPTSKEPVNYKAAGQRSAAAAADMDVLAAVVRMDVRTVVPHLSVEHTAEHMAFERRDAEVAVAANMAAGSLA